MREGRELKIKSNNVITTPLTYLLKHWLRRNVNVSQQLLWS